MPKLRTTLFITFAALIGGSNAHANTLLAASILNSAENPPTVPTTVGGLPRVSFGSATFNLNDAMTAMTFTATVFGIDPNLPNVPNGMQSADPNDNLAAAHIHAGPLVTPTTNAGVVWGFFGMPFNDNNPNDMVLTPFATGVGFTISGKWDAAEGNGTTLAAQLDNILNGRAYINFHTNQFGGGEIRGNMSIVPEPSAIVVVGSAIVAIAFMRRRLGSTATR